MRLLVPEHFAIKEVDEFRQRTYELLDKGNSQFTIDFSHCKFIDSTGLGVLVSIYKRCNESNGSLRVQAVNNTDVRRVFKLTRLDTIFGI